MDRYPEIVAFKFGSYIQYENSYPTPMIFTDYERWKMLRSQKNPARVMPSCDRVVVYVRCNLNSNNVKRIQEEFSQFGPESLVCEWFGNMDASLF